MDQEEPTLDNTKFSAQIFVVAVIAGGLAGMAADFVVLPIDAIKTRMQASSDKVDFEKEA